MTGKQFINAVANGKQDVLSLFIEILEKLAVEYCVIGGLAVNAYAEPVVSLDLDIVISVQKLDVVCNTAEHRGFKIEKFEQRINLTMPGSDLRIQLRPDSRYQSFIEHAAVRNVLGYRMMVAAVEDVLKGKTWAYLDKALRKSKRQKDLADITRLVENKPELEKSLPQEILTVLSYPM